ncbi:MAG: FtsX-like permease family protein [Clostridiales bacterium]|nr:FtsX-like permease family protein [Clostridiales bacterium]
MKKTQRTDAIRNITKQIVSYLSIVIIAILAIVAYLGINYASKAIGDNGSVFYNNNNFRDIELYSSYLITADDMEAILACNSVADVEGVLRTEAKIFSADKITSINVVSLTTRINTPELIDGRQPEEPFECVVEQSVINETGLTIGSTVEVLNSGRETPSYLTRSEFVITGIVYHPDHSCWPSVVPDNGYILVLPEAFDTESLNGCYMSALVRVNDTEGLNRFSRQYLNIVNNAVTELNPLADERAVIRYNEITDMYQTMLNDNRQSLDDANNRLVSARTELDSNWELYYEGADQLNEASQQLEESEQELQAASIELQNGRNQLDSSSSELAAINEELNIGQAELDTARMQLEQASNELSAAQNELAMNEAELNAAQARLSEAENELSGGAAAIAAGEAQLSEARQQLESSYQQIEDAKTSVRDTLEDAIIRILGRNIADTIEWSDSSYDINVDDPEASASVFPITNSISIDLRRTLGDNIFSLISSLGIPEDELRRAFEETTNVIIDYSEDHPLISVIVEYIEAEYNDIDNGYNQFAQAASTWDSGHNDYLSGVQQLNNARYTYNEGVRQYSEGRAAYEQGLSLYNEGLTQYNASYAEYLAGMERYEEGLAEYEQARSDYNAALSELNRGEIQYQEGLNEYNEGLAAYEQGILEYEQGQTELQDSLTRLQEGEQEYESGLQEYEEGFASYQEAADRIETLEECHWIVINTEGNAGYATISEIRSNVGDLGVTFALIFILVGSFVIYATSGRIIDDQRNLVGTAKALGFTRREILAKYLIFGVSSTIAGMVTGIVLGYFTIQPAILGFDGRYFVYGEGEWAFNIPLTVIVFSGGLILSVSAVLLACNALLKSPAIVLLQDSVPRAPRKSSSAKSSRTGSLYGRMIFLNMMSDKKRGLVTVASIAGCCALLVAGFSMKFALYKSVDKQFNDIEHYDLKVRFDPSISQDADAYIETILEEYSASYIKILDTYQTYKFNGTTGMFELLCGNEDLMNDYFVRVNTNTNELETSSGNGIWIYKALSDNHGIHSGDTLTLLDNAMNPHEANIDGVYMNYAGQFVLMTEDAYLLTFGNPPEYNSFLIRTNDADIEVIEEKLSHIDGVMEIIPTSDRYEQTINNISLVDYLAVLFIGIAAMMAYFILLNLVTMYINQKKKELTIMRINGFTLGQTILYASLEIILYTLAGIIIGLGVGSVLAIRINTLIGGVSFYPIRTIQFEAWGLATLITIIYSFLISAWALRKVKRLRLTDINE